LFEAGIVESGMRNLTYGDRDSIGFLQQRPSQGWGTVSQIMNVEYATTSFVTRAKKIENNYDTSGKLAQGVQRSAYPDKYDKVKNKAVNLIKQVGNIKLTITLPVEGATEKNISSYYGEQRSDHIHQGLDIAMPYGSKVFTLFGGQVSNIGYEKDGYGNFVIVLNPNGYQELFGHLSRVTVSKGQNLTKGQKIGEVGSTGSSTGNHLHYEIRTPTGTKIDPLQFLRDNGSIIDSSNSENAISQFIKNFIADTIANQVTIWVYLAIFIIIFIALLFIFKKEKDFYSYSKKAVGSVVDIGASLIPGGSIAKKGIKKSIKKVGGS
jgi:murein DD-endopeptidase MepM/ murein hydrolase activator NlpD